MLFLVISDLLHFSRKIVHDPLVSPQNPICTVHTMAVNPCQRRDLFTMSNNSQYVSTTVHIFLIKRCEKAE